MVPLTLFPYRSTKWDNTIDAKNEAIYETNGTLAKFSAEASKLAILPCGKNA